MATFKAKANYMAIASGSLVKFGAKGAYSTNDKAIIEALNKNPNVDSVDVSGGNDELESLRQQYFDKFGEKPHGSMRESTLREKLEAGDE